MFSKDYLLSLPNINNDNMILLHNLYNSKEILGNNICNENFYNDTHIFNSNNIYSKLNNNISDLGSVFFQYKLCNPIDNINEIENNNQKIILNFLKNDYSYDFNIINEHLNNILWFYKKRTKEENTLLNN